MSDRLDSRCYRGFEDRFRGSIDEMREKQRVHRAGLRGRQRRRSTSAADAASSSRCSRSAGIERARRRHQRRDGRRGARRAASTSSQADASAYLESLPDESLGGVIASQVIEHLEPSYLMRAAATIASGSFGRARRSCSRRSTPRAGSRSSAATCATSRTSGRCIPRRCIPAAGQRLRARRDQLQRAGAGRACGCAASIRRR